MSERGVTGQDRISLLPDQLLGHILSHLPTKDSVSTSVLSKRWKTVWLSVPMLDLDILEFPGYYEFVSFLERFLDFSKETCIYKLKLAFVRNKLDPAYMTKLIHNAIIRKVKHLDLLCHWSYLVETLMHLSVYTCETLVYLKLSSVSLAHFEYVSLPRLKIMHLEDSVYTNDALLEKLISSCPVLEDLKVVRNVAIVNTAKVLGVRSQSLNSVILVLNSHMEGSYDREVVVDAPGLNYLSLTDYQSRSFVISNLSSSAKVNIDVNFYAFDNSAESASSKRSVVRKFLTGLSSVRDMTISGTTLKVICHYLKDEPLPKFPHMSRLHVNSYKYDLEKLPYFLEICPNLKSIVLDLVEYKNEQVMLSSSVPECLRSSLDYVVIKTPISGAEAAMKLVKYFLENSAVLKKLTMRLSCRKINEESVISMGILKLRRCSASCEVVVESEEADPTMIHMFL